MNATKVSIDVWSDYACALCALVNDALRQLDCDHPAMLDIRWHALEQASTPNTPTSLDEHVELPAWSRALYQSSLTHNEPRLFEHGWRTRTAHEVAVFAGRHGRFGPVHEALFRAGLEEGLDIGDETVLLSLAERHGLNRTELAAALHSGRALEQLFADRQAARALGVTEVPVVLVRATGAPLEQARRLLPDVLPDGLDTAVRDALVERERTT